MRRKTIMHEFVEFIPSVLEDGTVYVSIRFATSAHKCLCGCGSKVVIPLSPTGWELRFDGKTISLYPSIGNWNLSCKSHYWIRRNGVIRARRWSQEEIDEGRASERAERQEYFEEGATEAEPGKPGRKGRDA